MLTTTTGQRQQRPHDYFPEPSIVQIRGNAEFGARDWFMAMDAHRFHVYVVVALDPNVWLRIDWDDNSTLTFKPLEPNAFAYNQRFHVGTRRFSHASIKRQLTGYMQEYKLFRFNCRTVSFAVLCAAGFNPDLVFRLFEQQDVLCGLVEDECPTWSSFVAYLKWQIAHDRAAIEDRHYTGTVDAGACVLF